jgi:hypothetical protein
MIFLSLAPFIYFLINLTSIISPQLFTNRFFQCQLLVFRNEWTFRNHTHLAGENKKILIHSCFKWARFQNDWVVSIHSCLSSIPAPSEDVPVCNIVASLFFHILQMFCSGRMTGIYSMLYCWKLIKPLVVRWRLIMLVVRGVLV